MKDNNLKAELVRKGIRPADIAVTIGTSVTAVYSKLHGHTHFSLRDAFAIRDRYFPNYTIDYLFDYERS